MNTRTLEILKNDKTTMLSLVEPGAGGEVIARIDPATVHSDPLREVQRRYNAHNAMLAALQEYHKAVDTLAAMLISRDPEFFLSRSGQPWEAMKTGHALIESLNTK